MSEKLFRLLAVFFLTIPSTVRIDDLSKYLKFAFPLFPEDGFNVLTNMEYGTVSFEGILFAIAYHNEWWYPNLKLNFVFGGLHSA